MKGYDLAQVRQALEIFRDYHDTKMSSSEFLVKHCLLVDALDNSFLKMLAQDALEVLNRDKTNV